MIDARVKQLVPTCPPLAASLGKQAGGGSHVTLKRAGKTQTVYVPKDLTEEVQASIQEHRRIKRLLREITQLQLELIRSHNSGSPAPAGIKLGGILGETLTHFWPDCRSRLYRRDQHPPPGDMHLRSKVPAGRRTY